MFLIHAGTLFFLFRMVLIQCRGQFSSLDVICYGHEVYSVLVQHVGDGRFLDKFTAHCNSMLQKLLSSFCVPLYYLSDGDPKKVGQNLVFPYHGQRNHRYHLPTQVLLTSSTQFHYLNPNKSAIISFSGSPMVQPSH
jgi:hypothetical protein